MPGSITFLINASAGNCAVGQILRWTATGSDEQTQIANAQAVFSLLMSAKLSGQKVQIYGLNSNCTVQYVQLVN
jgi:hypothetical protein